MNATCRNVERYQDEAGYSAQKSIRGDKRRCSLKLSLIVCVLSRHVIGARQADCRFLNCLENKYILQVMNCRTIKSN